MCVYELMKVGKGQCKLGWIVDWGYRSTLGAPAYATSVSSLAPEKWKTITTYLYCTVPGNCTGIFNQSMEARNQVGIGLSYSPARLNRLAELTS